MDKTNYEVLALQDISEKISDLSKKIETLTNTLLSIAGTFEDILRK